MRIEFKKKATAGTRGFPNREQNTVRLEGRLAGVSVTVMAGLQIEQCLVLRVPSRTPDRSDMVRNKLNSGRGSSTTYRADERIQISSRVDGT